jgi:hypothetical protein
MDAGRNDPCPCGSGKKYKRCCEPLDRTARAAGAAAGHVRATAAAAASWQADLVPVPAQVSGDAASRLTALLVVADGFVVHSDTLERASPEPAAMAAALAAGISAASVRVGDFPARVVVREPVVATALTDHWQRAWPSADRTPPPAVTHGPLAELDEAAFSLNEHLCGHAMRYFLSFPDTWAAWGLSEDVVGGLFRNAALLYRAAPWKAEGLEALDAVLPAGSRWLVNVFGQLGEELGLALFSHRDDFLSMRCAGHPAEAFADLQGRVLNLTFDGGSRLPRALRREVAAAGWEVAGPAAYPRLFTVNSPAGGLRQCDAADLAQVLAALARFVAVRDDLVRGEPWTDDATGVRLVEHPAEAPAAAEPSLDGLGPGAAEGPGAEPEAAFGGWATLAAADDSQAIVDAELAIVDSFRRYLAEELGLAGSTVDRDADHATRFVEFLAGNGVPVRAVHEYDLRTYLFEHYPRKEWSGVTRAAALPIAIARFFTFLAEHQGIVCSWAAPLLADRQAIAARWEAPEGAWWDDEVAEWLDEHRDDLVARVMIPDSELGDDGDAWGATMGITEAGLHHELMRRWLVWRDELLRAGVASWGELVERLVAQQHAWEQAPLARLGGTTPLAAVRAERAKRARPAGRGPRRRRR